jgi:hypothetical protein
MDPLPFHKMRTKRKLLSCLGMLLALLVVKGQVIKGHVLDSLSGKPLEYVSIGIIDTPHGCITDEKGSFSFEAGDQEPSSRLRISMIGYEAQVFSLDEFMQLEKEVQLVPKVYELAGAEVKPWTRERKAGSDRIARMSGWSGWGGTPVRKGYEMGTRIDLGERPVKIKNLQVRLHRQAFDTSYFRLHMRAMKDTLILEELLTQNIVAKISEESGWALIDLEPYQLVLSGTVGVTLEWLKVEGLNQDRAMKINDRMQEAYLLFKNQKNAYGLYRWGTEARWIINKKVSPGLYVTVLE